jgi:hypothetical protein
MKKVCVLCKVKLYEWIHQDSFPSFPNCDWFFCSRCGTLFSDIFLKQWRRMMETGEEPPDCYCSPWGECDICGPKEAFGI